MDKMALKQRVKIQIERDTGLVISTKNIYLLEYSFIGDYLLAQFGFLRIRFSMNSVSYFIRDVKTGTLKELYY